MGQGRSCRIWWVLGRTWAPPTPESAVGATESWRQQSDACRLRCSQVSSGSGGGGTDCGDEGRGGCADQGRGLAQGDKKRSDSGYV